MPFKLKLCGPILGFLISLLSATPLLAQSLQERSEKIRQAVTRGQTKAALDELQEFKAVSPAAFPLNNYDYLRGRLLERSDDLAGALSSYQSVVARRSLLSQYALWHLSQLARLSGDLVLERERLRQLMVTAPASMLLNAATLRLAESFAESKDQTAVISTLRPLTESKNFNLARQALMMTGTALLQAGKRVEAREIFSRLISSLPDSSRPDDFALAAVRELDALDRTNPGTPSETDHLRRASVYQFNRDFSGARVHYLAVIEQAAGSPAASEALYQTGRGLYQEGKYDEALKYLRRVNGSYDESSSARDALALIAGTLSRQKQTDAAVTAYKQFIERYPSAPLPERPYLNIIDVLRDAGRDDEALAWVKQTRERFKNQTADALALFAQARIHLAQSSWAAALTDLDELEKIDDPGGPRVTGGTTRSEVLFLRALVLEQLGRLPEAIDVYLSIPAGRNEYYGFRANEHLRLLGSEPRTLSLIKAKSEALTIKAKSEWQAGAFESARQAAQAALRLEMDAGKQNELLELLKRVYENLPVYKFPSLQLLAPGRAEVITAVPTSADAEISHRALAKELLFLGLYDEGSAELAVAATEGSGNGNAPANGNAVLNDEAYTTAVYYFRGEAWYPAVRFAEQTWRRIPSDYQIELAPRQLTEMLYPAAYRASVMKYAPARQLDPRFVLAIARQETRFQADAKSVAAARGLMQFIAATALEMAGQLGRQAFQQDELYNPDTALEFGSHYLSSLFRQFPNQPPAVAAAYNGGADNMARWIARSHSREPDRYVPEIGFAQSKDYVFRVMSNYWVYQQLYNETLQPRP